MNTHTHTNVFTNCKFVSPSVQTYWPFPNINGRKLVMTRQSASQTLSFKEPPHAGNMIFKRFVNFLKKIMQTHTHPHTRARAHEAWNEKPPPFVRFTLIDTSVNGLKLYLLLNIVDGPNIIFQMLSLVYRKCVFFV